MHAGDKAVKKQMQKDEPSQVAKRSAARGAWETTENALFQQLCDVVDTRSAEHMAVKARRMPGLRQAILDHHDKVFACVTKAGSRQKERDWLTYWHVTCGQKIPAFAEGHLLKTLSRCIAPGLIEDRQE